MWACGEHWWRPWVLSWERLQTSVICTYGGNQNYVVFKACRNRNRWWLWRSCSIHRKQEVFYVRLLWMLLTIDLLPISIKSIQIGVGKQDNVTQNDHKRMQNNQKKTQNDYKETQNDTMVCFIFTLLSLIIELIVHAYYFYSKLRNVSPVFFGSSSEKVRPLVNVGLGEQGCGYFLEAACTCADPVIPNSKKSL